MELVPINARIRYAAAFALSFVFALWWTPVMRRAALQLGILDSPDGKLKNHESAVPYLGGLAVFNRALTDAEMKALHDSADVAALNSK